MPKSKTPRKPWWLSTPALVAASLTALGAMGTAIVKTAAFLTLPEKVEAGEKKNQQQDAVLLQQTAILDVLKDAYQQDVQQRQDADEWYWDARTRQWIAKPPRPSR